MEIHNTFTRPPRVEIKATVTGGGSGGQHNGRNWTVKMRRRNACPLACQHLRPAMPFPYFTYTERSDSMASFGWSRCFVSMAQTRRHTFSCVSMFCIASVLLLPLFSYQWTLFNIIWGSVSTAIIRAWAAIHRPFKGWSWHQRLGSFLLGSLIKDCGGKVYLSYGLNVDKKR